MSQVISAKKFRKTWGAFADWFTQPPGKAINLGGALG